MEGFDVYKDMVHLCYRVGGATMGTTWQCLFNSKTGKLAYKLADCADFLIDGDTVVKTDSFAAPTPNNLHISRDRGKTWESLGDPKYIYNRVFMVADEDGNWSYSTLSTVFRMEDGYLYTDGVDTSTWNEDAQPMDQIPLRVDLATGETVVLSDTPQEE